MDPRRNHEEGWRYKSDGGGAGGDSHALFCFFFTFQSLQTSKRSLSFLLFSFHLSTILSIHLPQADGRSREFLRSRFPAARKT